MVHGGREQEVVGAHGDDGDADSQRQVSSRPLRLAAGLRDCVKTDEACEQDCSGGEESGDVERRGARRHGPVFALEQCRGEIGLVEPETRHDDNATQCEHQEHHRDQGTFVGFRAHDINADESPDHRERQPHPHGARLEKGGQLVPFQGAGDVAEERHDDVGDHADHDRQAEPLREAGHEAEIGMQATAGIDVAAPGTRHRRGQDSVGQCRKPGRDRRKQERRQHPVADAWHVALDHERHDVHGRAQHRADAGRREAQEAQLAAESGRGPIFGCRIQVLAVIRLPPDRDYRTSLWAQARILRNPGGGGSNGPDGNARETSPLLPSRCQTRSPGRDYLQHDS